MSKIISNNDTNALSNPLVINNSIIKDEKWWQTEFDDSSSDNKVKSKDNKDQDKEINKWKKAYFQEKQNHKATKDVLDQALALSMKLLEEVKSLDVRLYQETERNKRFKWANLENKMSKDPWDRGTSGSPSRIHNDEHSGSSYSQFIRKSTEEIENIIRRIQFDSDKKKSAEKPPQAPKAQK